MAFTSKATGNWSSPGQTTWNEIGTPGPNDQVTISNPSHVITIDVPISRGNAVLDIGGGTLIVAAAVTMGTADTQANCIVRGNGGTLQCVPGGSLNANMNYGNTFGLDVFDCDIAGFPDVQVNSWGIPCIKIRDNRIDRCGLFPKMVYTHGEGYEVFDVSGNKWTNTTGAEPCQIQVNSNGLATTTIKPFVRNRFDKPPFLKSVQNLVIDYNVFLRSYHGGSGKPKSCRRNLLRTGAGDSEVLPMSSMIGNFWLGNLDHPGNPHCFTGQPANTSVLNNLFELPGPSNGQDSGECVYSSQAGVTVNGNLAIPSETDGRAIGNMAHHSAPGAGWIVEHNTVVGSNNAYIAYSEAGTDPGKVYASVKGNLVVDLVGDMAAVFFFVFADTQNFVDLVLPSNCIGNGKFGTLSYTDPNNSAVYDGHKGRFSSPPGVGDIKANPVFVDPSRTFSRYGVFKGICQATDTLAVRTQATLDLICSDPMLMDELIPWVFAGFAPTNTAFQGMAPDGGDMGAVPVGGVVPPLVEGALSAGAKTISVTLTAPQATGGQSPYSYQWHRSQTNGFVPDGATAIPNATALVLNESGLDLGQTYYYRVVVVDSANATAMSPQLIVTT